MGRSLRCALAGALPQLRQKTTRIARPSDGPEYQSDSITILEEAIVRKFSTSIRNLPLANMSA